MAISYSWQFDSLSIEIGPDTDNHSNVVYLVGWLYSADDGDGHAPQVFGSMSVKPWEEEGEPWIEYEDLTEADVQGWVEEQLGEDEIAAMKTRLDAQIAELATPTHETHRTMPWDDGD